MIFVFPAAISENVDKRYLPAIIKTMELYYLYHIAEAASSGVLRFYNKEKFFGGYDTVRVENDYSGLTDFSDYKVIYEQSDMILYEGVQEDIDKLRTDLKEVDDKLNHAAADRARFTLDIKQKEDDNNKEKLGAENSYDSDYDNLLLTAKQYGVFSEFKAAFPGTKPISAQEWNSFVEQAFNNRLNYDGDYLSAKRQLAQANSDITLYSEQKKQILVSIAALSKTADSLASAQSELAKAQQSITKDEKDKLELDKLKQPAAPGGAKVSIDTTTMLDLRPTACSIDVQFELRSGIPLPFLSKTKMGTTKQIMIGVKIIPMIVKNFDDVYDVFMKDSFSNIYSSLYKSAFRSITRTAYSMFRRPVDMFLKMFVDPNQFNIQRDILLSKKSFIDGSAFYTKIGSPSYQTYSSSIIIMSVNDLKRASTKMFDSPSKISKLQNLGWNSFAIADDPSRELVFCSHFDNGLCSKIPYQYVFQSLKANDLFKDLDSLSKFTTRVIANIKRIPIKKLGSN